MIRTCPLLVKLGFKGWVQGILKVRQPEKELIVEDIQTDEIVMRKQANEARKEKRNQIADLDKTAWLTYVELGSWNKAADALGFANGAVARRAALRHRALVNATTE